MSEEGIEGVRLDADTGKLVIIGDEGTQVEIDLAGITEDLGEDKLRETLQIVVEELKK